MCTVYICICICMYIYMYICTFSFVVTSETRPFHSQPNSRSPSFTLQTCLPRGTADMSGVGDGRRVCHVTHQTCLLCDTAEMSAV